MKDFYSLKGLFGIFEKGHVLEKSGLFFLSLVPPTLLVVAIAFGDPINTIGGKDGPFAELMVMLKYPAIVAIMNSAYLFCIYIIALFKWNSEQAIVKKS